MITRLPNPADSIIDRRTSLVAAVVNEESLNAVANASDEAVVITWEAFAPSDLAHGLTLQVQSDFGGYAYRVKVEGSPYWGGSDFDWYVMTDDGRFRSSTSWEYKTLEDNYEAGTINPTAKGGKYEIILTQAA